MSPDTSLAAIRRNIFDNWSPRGFRPGATLQRVTTIWNDAIDAEASANWWGVVAAIGKITEASVQEHLDSSLDSDATSRHTIGSGAAAIKKSGAANGVGNVLE